MITCDESLQMSHELFFYFNFPESGRVHVLWRRQGRHLLLLGGSRSALRPLRFAPQGLEAFGREGRGGGGGGRGYHTPVDNA